MTDYTKMIENYNLFQNWKKPENRRAISQIINMDEEQQFKFRRKARTSLIKATDMLPLRQLLGSKTKGTVSMTAGNHRVWVLPSHRTKLLTLQVLLLVLPEGDLFPFLQYFCGLDVTDSDRVTREIAKDNLWQLERNNTHMKGKGLKAIFWTGTPKSALRKSSDDLLTVARAICMVTYSKLFTRGLLTEEANKLLDPTITLTNFSLKELKSVISPAMSITKIHNCMSVFLLAGWLKRLPEKYTHVGAQELKNKEAGIDNSDYTVAPSIYQMASIDTVDWGGLLEVINLDTTAGIRFNLVNQFMGYDIAKQFLIRKGDSLTVQEIATFTQIRNQLQEDPNMVIPKRQALMMLQRSNMDLSGNTVKQHLKDLIIWKQFNLIEISSKLAYMLHFNSQKRTLTDKVIVNAAEYYARKNA